MKQTLSFILSVFFTFNCCAQVQLPDKDLNNLLALAKLYSYNNMCSGERFARSADSLRTPVLDHVIDAMVTIGKGDTTILSKKYLGRPSNDELMLWYTIHEVHYDRIDTSKSPSPPEKIARETLAKTIDERLLVDNYYDILGPGVAIMFNTAELSNRDINMNDLGLKDDTEKAIFYYKMICVLAYDRFSVLSSSKKYKPLLEFARRMPKFNGKPYYNYRQLNFADFDFLWDSKIQSYKNICISYLMSTVIMHFLASEKRGEKEDTKDLYFNSILFQPIYFVFSDQKQALQELYLRSK